MGTREKHAGRSVVPGHCPTLESRDPSGLGLQAPISRGTRSLHSLSSVTSDCPHLLEDSIVSLQLVQSTHKGFFLPSTCFSLSSQSHICSFSLNVNRSLSVKTEWKIHTFLYFNYYSILTCFKATVQRSLEYECCFCTWLRTQQTAGLNT